jgi:hypothetical protein
MIAWVLIISLGTQYAVSVSNIVSEAECNALGNRIKEKTKGTFNPYIYCFSYETRPTNEPR